MTLREKLLQRQTATLSPLMAERTKLATEDIVGLDLTISAVDLVEKDGETFAVVNFAQCPDRFYFGGKVLTDIVCDIYEILGKELSEVVELSEDERVTIRAHKEKSKNGRFYTAFDIV